jgi:tRNA (guanine-N7-)-methyltransferase
VSDSLAAALTAPAPTGPAGQGGGAPPRLALDELRQEGLERTVGPAPRVLEIGFGRGELLLATAAARPAQRFLGVEVSGKRVAKLARRVVLAELGNLRLLQGTAEELLFEKGLPDAAFAECWVHCPDPWPKRRHHRRRFFQPESARRLARVLEPGGVLHASTDHLEYAHWIARVLGGCSELENLCAPAPWSAERPTERGATGYEADWLAEGRSIAYFRYRRRASAAPVPEPVDVAPGGS